MAPTQISQFEEIGCLPDAPYTPILSEHSKAMWIVPVMVVGTIAIVTTIVFLVSLRIKKTTVYSRACEKDPILSWGEFSRRHKLSTIQRQQEDELQRRDMIRKALASKRLKFEGQK